MNPYLEASRPKTWSTAMSPVLVGSACALLFSATTDTNLYDTKETQLWLLPQQLPEFIGRTILCLIIALSATIAVNYLNDLLDGISGADTPDRLGPRRAVASGLLTPKQVGIAFTIAMTVFVLSGIFAVIISHSVTLLLVGIICALCLILYSYGPYSLSRLGLAGPVVIGIYGLTATAGTAFILKSSAPFNLIMGLCVGLFAWAVLKTNNIRDIDEDKKTGKKTLAVRLGKKNSVLLYKILLGTPFILLPIINLYAHWAGEIPFLNTPQQAIVEPSALQLASLAQLVALIPAVKAAKIMTKGEGKDLLVALALTGKTMLIWSIAIAVSFIITFLFQL